MTTGKYLQVRTDQADTTIPVERMITSARDWLDRGCKWTLVAQDVTVLSDPEQTLDTKCGSVVAREVQDEQTCALVVGLSSGSPLTQRHLIRLAELRRAVSKAPILLIQMMEFAQLSSAIEFNASMLGEDRVIRPVMVVPEGDIEDYISDFDAALIRDGLRLVTQHFGVVVRSLDQVATVLKSELSRTAPMNGPGPDCLSAGQLRRFAQGEVDTTEFAEALRHVGWCTSCSGVTRDFATIERFRTNSLAVA